MTNGFFMVERQTAIKTDVQTLINGRYVQKEGWEPNYVQTKYGCVSRANVMGVITQETSPGVFVLDDGTATITLRTFEEPITIAIGSAVQVIGRPRTYNNEFFLLYEIIKPVKNEWLSYRKKELSQVPVVEEDATMKTVPSQEEAGEEIVVRTGKENIFSKLLRLIRSFDKENNNEGARIEDLIAACEEAETEQVLNNLVEEGEVFEIRPGLIKVLE